MSSKPAIANIEWSKDNHALVWGLLAELEKDRNHVLLFGLQKGQVRVKPLHSAEKLTYFY